MVIYLCIIFFPVQNITDGEIELVSPNYPSEYPNNADYDIRIVLDQIIKLRFIDFHIQSGICQNVSCQGSESSCRLVVLYIIYSCRIYTRFSAYTASIIYNLTFNMEF